MFIKCLYLPFFNTLTYTFILFTLQLSTKLFTDKDVFVQVQMHVEDRLNGKSAFVHPYCLSLDSIGNALFSLVTNKCITKQTITGGKPPVQYTVELQELDKVLHQLRRYCSALTQLNGLSNYVISAKL